MNILEAKSVVKSFGGVFANMDVSFNVQKGEILGLIGPNGSGKTTLINNISGNIKADKGSIRFEGKEIVGLKPHTICHLGISRTYQVVQPFIGMTVLENTVAGALFGRQSGLRSLKTATAKANEVLDTVHLSEKANELAEDLITADQKKLELAKVLAGEPKLLLLDEVMAGLTLKEIEDAMELIMKIRENGITLFVVEHVMKAVMGISDRVMVLHQGSLMATGTPQEISRNERVIEAYLGAKYIERKTIK